MPFGFFLTDFGLHSTRMHRGIGTTLVAAAAALLITASGAHADTFQVTKTGDSNPNGCGQGGCTLREATIAANNENGADTIVLDAGKTYKIGIPGSGEDLSATGDFDLIDRTTVRAAGGGTAKVDGDDVDGIFEAFATARFEQLELTRANGNSIEVTGGDAVVERSEISKGSVGVRANDGDAIVRRTTFDDTSSNAVYQQGPGGVKVTDSQLLNIGSTGISEYEGGSVSIKGSTVKDTASNVVYESAEGSIRVAKSTVSKSGATGFGEYEGGSVTITKSKLEDFASNVVYESSVGDLRVSNSEVRQSDATAFGEYEDGDVVLKNVDAKNSASNMVYESNTGSVILDRTKLADAGATIVGEYEAGGIDMSRSKLDQGPSNGIYEAGEGGVEMSQSKISRTDFIGVQETDLGGVTLNRSSVSRSASNGVYVDEGKVRVSDTTIEQHDSTGLVLGSSADAVVEGSTLAGNGTTAESGGGIDSSGELKVENSTIYGNEASYGGGIYVSSGSARLNAVTVTRNSVESTGGGLADGSAMVKVSNSLIADNSAGLFGPDCYASSTYESGGHNLLSDGDFCTGLDVGSDKVKGNAKTDQLKDNGGPTKTAAIAQNSPAVDKAGTSAPPRDQRGHDRDSKPDIGAFER